MPKINTLVFAAVSQKGGTGKSTTNIMLATNLVAYHNKSLILIDTDFPQFSIVNKKQKEVYMDDGKTKKIDYPVIPVQNIGDNLKNTIAEYYGKVDYIIIDFKGTVNVEMIKGLGYLDYAFIPVTFDDLEVDATASFYETLQENFVANPEKPMQKASIFFNQYEKVRKTSFAGLREIFEEDNFSMLDNYVLRKTVYKDVYRSLIYPIPKNKEKGKDEYRSFITEIINKLNQL